MHDRSLLNRRHFLEVSAAGLAGSFCVNASLAADSAQWGDLIGRLVYDGPAPERKKVEVTKDVECCGKFDLRDESLIIGPQGGLSNAVIYLRDDDAPICPDLRTQTSDKVVLDNRDCIFQPHCMTVWVGKQTLEIINSDPVGQNVAFSPLYNPAANIVLPVDGKATYVFEEQERVPVKVLCNYHPWESGYILARANPYMAVTDMDGKFRISKLPVGKWTFQVWHERNGYLSTDEWRRGRFEMEIQRGTNDLGAVKLAPSLLERS